MLRKIMVLGATLLFVHCAHAPPPVAQASPPPPPPPQAPQAPEGGIGCPQTGPGDGCVTLKFSVTDSVRSGVKYPVRGNLFWALYRSHDVGSFGPGSHKPILSGEIHDVDLNGPGATAEVNLPDVSALKLKPLAYIDVKNTHSGTADPGDPVTLPHRAVEITPGAHVDVPVVFDFIR